MIEGADTRPAETHSDRWEVYRDANRKQAGIAAVMPKRDSMKGSVFIGVHRCSSVIMFVTRTSNISSSA